MAARPMTERPKRTKRRTLGVRPFDDIGQEANPTDVQRTFGEVVDPRRTYCERTTIRNCAINQIGEIVVRVLDDSVAADQYDDGVTSSPEQSYEFLVERSEGGPSVVHLTFSEQSSMTTFADALALAANAGSDASLWIHGTTPERRDHLEAAGFQSDRTLLQMFAPLPNAETDVVTRAFTPADIDEFVALNNRAFSWHPEQSGLTRDDVVRDMDAAWFDAEGFRLHHIDDELAAFCWTKVHDAEGANGKASSGTAQSDENNTAATGAGVGTAKNQENATATTDAGFGTAQSDQNNTAATGAEGASAKLGEIYVIAVDPKFHGRGLGKALTLAGLAHLYSVGIATSMLYVESDNTAAVATYEKLGFSVGRRDTLWRQK